MTDEKRNCNTKPLQIPAEGNQTLLPQQTTTVVARLNTTNTNNVTRSSPTSISQLDETADIIGAPSLATAYKKNESTSESPT